MHEKTNLKKFNFFLRRKSSQFIQFCQDFNGLARTFNKEPTNKTGKGKEFNVKSLLVEAKIKNNNSSSEIKIPELFLLRVKKFEEKQYIFFTLLRWRNRL